MLTHRLIRFCFVVSLCLFASLPVFAATLPGEDALPTAAIGDAEVTLPAPYQEEELLNSADTHENLGEAYYYLGDYEQMVKDFTKAIKAHPDNAKAYMTRGYAHYHLRHYDQAVRDFTRAIKLDPKNVDAYVYRGGIFSLLGDYAKAVADINTALKLNPKSKFAQVMIKAVQEFSKLPMAEATTDSP